MDSISVSQRFFVEQLGKLYNIIEDFLGFSFPHAIAPFA
jgi:hypothetical protein